MDRQTFAPALFIFSLVGIGRLHAQEALLMQKSLAPAVALELALGALDNCQKRGYQVAVAVVDRSGIIQVLLRDRYAGPHSPPTASGKALYRGDLSQQHQRICSRSVSRARCRPVSATCRVSSLLLAA